MKRALHAALFCCVVAAGHGAESPKAAEAATPAAPAVAIESDPYYLYMKNSPDFKPVRQDPGAWTNHWDTWIYMPWRFQWTIGTGDEGGQFCKDYGFNGGFADNGSTSELPWLEKWNLKFFTDHTAGKGQLFIDGIDFKKFMRDGRLVRQSGASRGHAQLDAQLYERLKARLVERIGKYKKSPMRIAYGLDDEISSGSFLKPIAWRVNEDDKAYEAWLSAYYGENAPAAQYVSADFLAPQYGRKLKDLDFSPLLDRLNYNDSVWANFLGSLVECSNTLDPEIPCGFAGGQSPNTWGGYNYAKLCKKIQWIEAYLGTAQSLIRSFNPTMPQVTTHGLGNPATDVWQMWWCFSHGNRGMIGWVQGWFDGNKPKPIMESRKAPNHELGEVQGPKMSGAKWVHDGVALYYSHPSVQVSWCLDIEPHKSTWVNRGDDAVHGSWHLARKAWETMLPDAGIQYNWISYDDVIVNGVAPEYKVVILPACYALSDVEAKRFRDFVERGGTLIADFGCGLFDQHGKGRTRGALDDLFGISHDGNETKQNFFSGKLWVETDQDAGFQSGLKKLFSTIPCKQEDGFPVAEPKFATRLVRKVGAGTAVYMNLSPQRYLLYRDEDDDASEKYMRVFTDPVMAGGVKPWVVLTRNGKRPHALEATYFTKNGRTMVFVVRNAAVTSSELGAATGGSTERGKVTVDVDFSATVNDVVNERTGEKLGSGRKFTVTYNVQEAAFLSFAGNPPGR
jgi:hypothetical protein